MMWCLQPVAHDREGAVQVPNLAMLCHVWVLRVTERSHVQRGRVCQDPPHVCQALEGHVLIRVASKHQARLMDQALEGFHRVIAEGVQHLARCAQACEVSGLL